MLYFRLQKISPDKLTLAVVEKLQLPDDEITDSKEEISNLNGKFKMTGEKYV